jgi:DNA helicase-2/ATP-dependent DNA helicase PcrA
MDTTHLLESLNPAQREAVCAPPGHLLVLAGAGSGKTRVLAHRIAWLIQLEGVMPYRILAVTFTNKAAREMRGRIEDLLGASMAGAWIGTFHGLAHRLLRIHWQDAELPEHFQILDNEDQYRLVRRVLKSLEIDETRWPPKQVQGFINARKEEGLRPKHVDDGGNFYIKQQIRLYQAYEDACQRASLVDFTELLLRAHELWLDRPQVLSHYQQRFTHLLVDEFQDTNALQYAWLRMLTGETGSLFVVGDDDQSIYGWRGARIENIQQFPRDFPGTRTLRLEQNYRSTDIILGAANALIANNAGRLGKHLWTSHAGGEPIKVYRAFDEQNEARFVAEQIRDWVREGHRYAEVGVLYRSNAQSRILEEALIRLGVPYRVYGGLRFFERAEIKDALAYLRLMQSRADDAAFERIVNTPSRGIGERTLGVLRDMARSQNISLWGAAQAAITQRRLNTRSASALEAFLRLIHSLDEETERLMLPEQVEHVLERSTLLERYRQQKGEQAQSRLENLQELVSAARQYAHEGMQEQDDLAAFLADAALEAGVGDETASDDQVQLMTLHAGKGLEFSMVFICGMEEDLFPHALSLRESGRLEEERRLCYVGITRAKQHLCLSFAELRRRHGQEERTVPSRFLREIPPQFIQEVRLGGAVIRERPPTARTGRAVPHHGISLGRRVRHPKFGEGIVLDYEGAGRHARVQVNFEQVGRKWLVVEYAKLKAL